MKAPPMARMARRDPFTLQLAFMTRSSGLRKIVSVPGHVLRADRRVNLEYLLCLEMGACRLLDLPGMRRITTVSIALAIAASTSACAQTEAPAREAAQTERLQCSDPVALKESASILDRMTVLEVQPVTFPNQDKSGAWTLSGTRLIVRPPEGVGADQFERALQCHGALVTLGRISRHEDDPTWLPRAVVDIRVEPKSGNLAVTLSSNSVSDNLKIYDRTVAFAKAQGSRAY
jgi:hypothetical protein